MKVQKWVSLTDTYSQNGILSTHSLAALVTQPSSAENKDIKVITRVEWNEMTSPTDIKTGIDHYIATKMGDMPVQATVKNTPLHKMLAEMTVFVK